MFCEPHKAPSLCLRKYNRELQVSYKTTYDTEQLLTKHSDSAKEALFLDRGKDFFFLQGFKKDSKAKRQPQKQTELTEPLHNNHKENI